MAVDNPIEISPVPPDDRILDLFHPAVSEWFRQALGTPTPAQVKGWPAIAAGQNTLLLAPTGSGKTLAAFLACLDQLWKAGDRGPGARVRDQLTPAPSPLPPHGVQLLYISPLKALNNDIYRNLHVPLLGVQDTALRRGEYLPKITVGLRTGDTTTQERMKQLRTPPQVLITTPESLHLLLTSNGREMLRSVRWCIVDEIHVLCPNKRGVFLAILLERLRHLIGEPGFVRIGLSATQRPMEEVARYLGGLRYVSEGKLEHRPVTIIDAGQRKNLDVQVVSPVERFGPLPEKSVWPSIYRYLYDQVQQHRSTIVFANNRRSVERITTALNELHEENTETTAPASQSGAALARSHHGSISLDVRRQTEEMLKEGRIRAVVATASLELGIDMGAVDLVCQVESSGNIARALQRVGRAGHLVGGQSKGRLVPKTLPDLLEQAALAREMLHGQVEELHVPTGCLDLVAQQVVAMVAVENWGAPKLYALLRQAYPCRDLTPEAFENVLDMVSGRFPADAFRELRPRIVWDRIHNNLHALPGSKQLALLNGGSIPDTGQYIAYIQGTTNRIGELDEEFIYERRVGDVFTLGTTSWRIESIEADRVYVSRSEGMPAMMPFWRGEKVARSSDLGDAVGRLIDDTLHLLAQNQEETQDWLQEQCQLDSYAARNLAFFLRRQIETAGAVPSHRTILCEAFRDQVGDWNLAFLSSLGARFHLTLRFALESLWRERYGYQPYCLHHDDGVLMRLVDIGDPPLDLLRQLDPAKIEQRVLNELADSALFAIRFRHNAARALMLPISSPDKRAPLWLQRLKARNLLQIARQHPRFPVVIETCRECLHDHLDVDKLRNVLEDIKNDRIQLVTRRAETPSPFAGQLLFGFTAAFMYDYDKVELRGTSQAVQIDKGLLDQMLAPETFDHLLDPRAVEQVERRLQGVGLAPRTAEELFEWIRKLGDVRDDEIPEAAKSFVADLRQQGRVIDWSVPNRNEMRLILAEDKEVYEAAWASNGVPRFAGTPANRASQPDMASRVPQAMAPANGYSREPEHATSPGTNEAANKILRRFLLTHALVGLEDVIQRYPFERNWVEEQLHHWSKQGSAVELQSWGDEPTVVFAAPENLDQVRRGSLALRRREVPTVSPTVFAHFVQRWQGRCGTEIGPSSQADSDSNSRPISVAHNTQLGPEGVRNTLERFQGLSLPRELWEQTILPSRVPDYQARWLDDITASGEWCWVCRSPTDGHKNVSFIRRDHLQFYPYPDPERPLEGDAGMVHDMLRNRGAMFVVDLAQATSLPPQRVKSALWELVDRGLVTNDRFDVLRRSDANDNEPGTDQRANLRAMRRHRIGRPEGRWSLIPWGQPEPEARALFEVQNLLERYGVVSRDLSLLDASLLPWRVHYEVLSRLELSGEVHRGYFVEGLAGAQFALPEAVRQLCELRVLPTDTQSLSTRATASPDLGKNDEAAWTGQSSATQSLVLLNSLDPANLYGSSAPLGWPLASKGVFQSEMPESENGTMESEEGEANEATWQRRAGNWLITKAGRIILAIEASGKRLWAASWASDDDLFAALQLLRDLLKTGHGLDLRGKISVEAWNGEPVLQSPAQKALEAVGFVRDYQSMTLYAIWS